LDILNGRLETEKENIDYEIAYKELEAQNKGDMKCIFKEKNIVI